MTNKDRIIVALDSAKSALRTATNRVDMLEGLLDELNVFGERKILKEFIVPCPHKYGMSAGEVLARIKELDPRTMYNTTHKVARWLRGQGYDVIVTTGYRSSTKKAFNMRIKFPTPDELRQDIKGIKDANELKLTSGMIKPVEYLRLCLQHDHPSDEKFLAYCKDNLPDDKHELLRLIEECSL